MMGLSPAAILADASGNQVGIILDGTVYRLQTVGKLLNVAGTQINPATEDTLALIKDTAGIKKITDPVTLAADQAFPTLSEAAAAAIIAGGRSRNAIGWMNVASAGAQPIRLGAYVEPAAAAQRSIVSTSANDAAAGTGARKVRITYYDNALAGPYTEDIVPNGTTAVNTVATNIRFVESMEVIEAGTLKTNGGIISLMTATGGGGTAIGIIVWFYIGVNSTFWAHFYVGTGRKAYISSLRASITAVSAYISIQAENPVNNPVTTAIMAPARILLDDRTRELTFDPPLVIEGPARVEMTVSPDSTTAGTVRGGVSFYDV